MLVIDSAGHPRLCSQHVAAAHGGPVVCAALHKRSPAQSLLQKLKHLEYPRLKPPLAQGSETDTLGRNRQRIGRLNLLVCQFVPQT
jgi:hypothetical protein